MARRLAADPVGLVFAARVSGDELAGLPVLEVEGLREDYARALLDSALAGPLDARVRDLIIAETQGNPLALLELPRALTPTELAGGRAGCWASARSSSRCSPPESMPRCTCPARSISRSRRLMAPPLSGSTAHARSSSTAGIPFETSARAACRLATLGFTEVYDYVAGKVDWLARNLAVQGTAANAPVADVRARIVGSPHRFALVTTAETTLLGRLRATTLDNSDDALRVSELMEAGPSTLGPHEPAAVIRARLDDKGLTYTIVTDPDGHLLGTVLLTALP